MYERVRELGGRLEIESGSMGTAVSAVLPLQISAQERDKKETPEPRSAGKPIDTSDVRIESANHPDGNSKGDNAVFSRVQPDRRRASRRLS
jgi:hypothetical protein